MNKRYHTKHGKYEPSYTKRLCAECNKKKEMQVGSDLCDDCLFKKTMGDLLKEREE